MIDINKKYQTRAGRDARIYAIDGSGQAKVHGAVLEEFGWVVSSWPPDGVLDIQFGHPSGYDLIEVKEKKQLTGFVNAYQNELCYRIFIRKDDADNMGSKTKESRMACIDLSKYNIFYEEGEGI